MFKYILTFDIGLFWIVKGKRISGYPSMFMSFICRVLVAIIQFDGNCKDNEGFRLNCTVVYAELQKST